MSQFYPNISPPMVISPIPPAALRLQQPLVPLQWQTLQPRDGAPEGQRAQFLHFGGSEATKMVG